MSDLLQPSLTPSQSTTSAQPSQPSGLQQAPHHQSTQQQLPPPPSRPTPSANPPPSHATAVDPAVHATLLRDYQRLKRRLENLERENEGLRASLWEVSWRWGKQKGKDKAKQNGLADEDDRVDGQASLSGGQTVVATQSVTQPEVISSINQSTRPTSAQSNSTDTSIPDLTPKPSLQTVPTSATTTPSLTRVPSASASAPPLRSPSGPNQQNTPSSPPSATSNTPITSTTTTPVPPPLSTFVAPSAPQSATPSSLAASLFPSVPAPAPPPSSAKSYDRSASLHRSAIPSSLRREDRDRDRDRDREREGERWKWGRAYELKAHRGAVYSLKFAGGQGGDKGIMLGSGGFDGVRVWKAKTEGEESESDKWDEGDVEEVLHLTCHSGPVSDLAFSPSQAHLVSGGYDSTIHVSSLAAQSHATPTHTPTVSSTAAFAPSVSTGENGGSSVWSHSTDGLVQSVCWVNPGAIGSASESGNLFAWGTSGKVVGLGDMRMKAIVGEWKSETSGMINSIQSFRHSPHLLIGDSLGQTLHFSLQTNSFVSAEPASVIPQTNPMSPPPASKKQPAISCLATNPAWQLPGAPKAEPRWLAGVGFDNFVRIYDRSADPLRAGGPKLVQTLKGKNRNWPIKATWFQGGDYVDASSVKRRPGTASTSRSRSGSFTGERHRHRSHHDDSNSDEDDDPPREAAPSSAGVGLEGPPARPLSSSLLLACGSSDPVVLLYDLSALSQAAQGVGRQGGAGGSAVLPQAQRLEGHKESVYAVDFLQAGVRVGDQREVEDEDEEEGEGEGVGSERGYGGEGLLASAGGDWTVRVWKPVFLEGR